MLVEIDTSVALKGLAAIQRAWFIKILVITITILAIAIFLVQIIARRMKGVVLTASGASADVASCSAQLAVSSQEMAATVTGLSREAAQAAELMGGVTAKADDTSGVLGTANVEVTFAGSRAGLLVELSDGICHSLNSINEITNRINLLALNANIEAARAGEAGLGFAVIANEVRQLAVDSKSSTDEINAIVQDIRANADSTVMSMDAVAKQMKRGLVQIESAASDARRVAELIERQSSGTNQISATTQQMAEAARNLAMLSADLDRVAVDIARHF